MSLVINYAWPHFVLLTACACNMTGANETFCHPETGQCSCRENVAGLQCDSCQTNFFGFKSGAGCSPCNCHSVYSSSLQCDDNSGICSCKTGINGGKCTGCTDQFYNLTNQGGYTGVEVVLSYIYLMYHVQCTM